jgi:hypothetical protein
MLKSQKVLAYFSLLLTLALSVATLCKSQDIEVYHLYDHTKRDNYKMWMATENTKTDLELKWITVYDSGSLEIFMNKFDSFRENHRLKEYDPKIYRGDLLDNRVAVFFLNDPNNCWAIGVLNEQSKKLVYCEKLMPLLEDALYTCVLSVSNYNTLLSGNHPDSVKQMLRYQFKTQTYKFFDKINALPLNQYKQLVIIRAQRLFIFVGKEQLTLMRISRDILNKMEELLLQGYERSKTQ